MGDDLKFRGAILMAIKTDQRDTFIALLQNMCNEDSWTLTITLLHCTCTANEWYLQTFLENKGPLLQLNDITVALHSGMQNKAPCANLGRLLQLDHVNIFENSLITANLLGTAVQTKSSAVLQLFLGDSRVDPSACNNAALKVAQAMDATALMIMLQSDVRVQQAEVDELGLLMDII